MISNRESSALANNLVEVLDFCGDGRLAASHEAVLVVVHDRIEVVWNLANVFRRDNDWKAATNGLLKKKPRDALKSLGIAAVPKTPEVESKLKKIEGRIYGGNCNFQATYRRLDNVVVHGYIIISIWTRLFAGIQ